MANEVIEVEWIATATKMVQVLDRLETKINGQEKALEKIAKTSEKAADAAAGSFNALEAELKQAEAALKKMEIGTKAFADQKKKVDELKKSLSGVKQAISETGTDTAKALDQSISKVSQMVAGMLAFNRVVTAITQELKKAEELRANAAQTERSVEQVMTKMALNVGAADFPAAKKMVEENAPRIGVSQQGLAELIAGAMSGGAQNLAEALKLSEATLKLTAGNAVEAQPIMTGMLSLANTTGNRNFEAMLGQLSQFQKASFGQDLAVSIRNSTAALAAANLPGDRVQAMGSEKSLELLSVMSQILADPFMATSGTASRRMFTMMDAFTAKREVKLDDGTVSKLTQQQVDTFNAINTFEGRKQAMRETPEIGKQFMSTIGREIEGYAGIRAIVKGTPEVLKIEQASADIVTAEKGALENFQGLAKAVKEATPAMQAENKALAGRQATETNVVGKVGQAEQLYNRAVDVRLSQMDIVSRAFERSVGKPLESAVMKSTARSEAEYVRLLAASVEQLNLRRGAPGTPERSAFEEQRTLIAEIRNLADAIDRQQQANAQPPMPVRVQVQQPAARPKEAPLPAETAP